MKINMAVSGFVAGLLADWATYFTTSIELASGIKGDSPFLPLVWKILIAFIPTQLPLGILEGAMTGGMVVLLYKKRPDLLLKMGVLWYFKGFNCVKLKPRTDLFLNNRF